VSGSEREALKRLARQPSTPQAIAERARIVLACADGQTNTAVADRLGVSGETVGKWRRRFVELRIDGLVDASRPGQPRKSARLAMTLGRSAGRGRERAFDYRTTAWVGCQTMVMTTLPLVRPPSTWARAWGAWSNR
jgi:hypothetical protein